MLNRLYIFIFIFYANLSAEAFDGYTLFTAQGAPGESQTFLIDNEELIINTWNHELGPASMPYMLPDSSIIYPYRVEFPTMESGGVGGGVKKITWEGTVVWDYIFSNETYQHHHDVEPLPSGNILILAWEKKTADEAYAQGRELITNVLNQMWSTAILELDPISGNIVWEWHLWDHLIQDVNPNLPNYGIIADHPELFNINCGEVGGNFGGPQGPNADWMHFNSIHYNKELDQIIISSRSQSEIFIIDHSTTTQEAASHTGGNSGHGGDFLYRWGNPQNYNQGTSNDQILGSQHSVNWIDNSFPGGGNIIIFNNDHNATYQFNAAIIEITLPLDENNNYIVSDNGVFGPDHPNWIIINDAFNTPIQGGAFRLPNGNTLVTQTHTATLNEVDLNGNIVWQYQCQLGSGSATWIARAQKYAREYLQDFIIGDLNNDQLLNILDIVILANLVLLGENFSPNGDINQDGNNNILDIVGLTNIILNQ